jgi:hypothetical protein
VETLLATSIVALMFWLAPTGVDSREIWQGLVGDSLFAQIAVPACYGLVVLFLEPFYVAAGFTMYLTRRSELEAWDVEQELRRAFAD